MNFGGIIAGALSGGAQAVGQIADDNLKEQAAMRAEQRSLALNMEKFKQEADYKLAQKRADEERIQGQRERVFDRADSNMRGKDAASIGAVASQVQGESPVMSSEEIAELAKDHNIRATWEKNNLVPKRTQSGVILAQMEAASQIGADPEIRKDLQTQYTSAAGAEREAIRQAQQDRRLDQADERLANDARRTDALIQKYEQDAGSKAAKEGLREHLSYLDGQRKRLADNLRDLRQSEKSELEAIPSYETAKREAVAAEYKKKREAAEQEDKMLSADYQRVRERLFSDGPAPAPAPRPGAPAPALGATPSGQDPNSVPMGGKKSFDSQETHDGRVSILMQEYRKAQAANSVTDMRSLERELRRLGVDPTKQSSDNAASAPGARVPLETFLKR